jgi:hypothetical protein
MQHRVLGRATPAKYSRTESPAGLRPPLEKGTFTSGLDHYYRAEQRPRSLTEMVLEGGTGTADGMRRATSSMSGSFEIAALDRLQHIAVPMEV